MNISITGDLGSGKSSVSDELKKRGYSYVSCGIIMREYGQKHNMSVLDVNKLAITDSSIDKYIDDRQAELGKKRTKAIFDGRLSWYFVPNSFKVYLTVDKRISAERVFKDSSRKSETYNSVEETYIKINERQSVERERYYKKYGVDYLNFNNYDLIIDSSDATPKQIAKEILRLVNKGIYRNTIEVSPYRIYPTQNTRDLNENVLKKYVKLYNSYTKLDYPICCSADNNGKL